MESLVDYNFLLTYYSIRPNLRDCGKEVLWQTTLIGLYSFFVSCWPIVTAFGRSFATRRFISSPPNITVFVNAPIRRSLAEVKRLLLLKAGVADNVLT